MGFRQWFVLYASDTPSAFYFSPSRRQGRYKTILGDADEYLKQLTEAKRKIILLQ